MGKAAKTRRSEQRKRQKRSRKDQQQAVYESYKKAGTNKKSKRNAQNAKAARGVSTSKHLVSNCGNVGCERCFPDLSAPRMNAACSRWAPARPGERKTPVPKQLQSKANPHAWHQSMNGYIR